MRKRGVDLRFKADIVRIDKNDKTLKATLTDGSAIEADQIFYATGRASKTPNLGLASAGVAVKENGAVIVNEYSQSTVENIYAIGDCTDRMMLTPVAIAEGMAVAQTLFNNNLTKPSYLNVPTVVFSTPNCGTVGLSEDEARAGNLDVDIYLSRFRPLKHTLTGRNERMMMKLVVDRTTDQVLGCHMVGSDAGEILQGLAIALNCGATKAQFDATIGIHPTAAEEFVTMRTKIVD
jgi:glutathione reductase (NADPH)